MVKLEELQKFLIEKAIIFPTAEIYGSFAGFFDYGPLGVELKNAVKQLWWKTFVQKREEVVGMDGSIITQPKVWKASGHTDVFQDPMVECSQCKARLRADQIVEDKLKISAEGLSLDKLNEYVSKIKCPKCGGKLSDAKYFNLMFQSQVGAVGGNSAYLRPETAQLIFADFHRIYKSSRLSLPFGIAQIGKSFRNEISPRNFIFRAREFEQMEVEYFIKPKTSCPWLKEFETLKINVWTADAQESKKDVETITIKELVKNKVTSDWHAYWLGVTWKFFSDLGIKTENLRLRQHRKKELSHYAIDTWDFEYNYPFGWKELAGVANRSSYDLSQHEKISGKELKVIENGERITPFVIEPSFGVGRLVMALLSDAWAKDERQYLTLNAKIAPIQVAIFPLIKKEGMPEVARKIVTDLIDSFRVFYDEKGSVGRRYRRQDSIGTPFCITVDGETLKNNTITLRERDSMEQKRVKISELKKTLLKLLNRHEG